MSLYKKLFRLWHKHTIGCCRVLFALLIVAAVWDEFTNIYCPFLLIMWLILKTGYEKKWEDEDK